MLWQHKTADDVAVAQHTSSAADFFAADFAELNYL